MINQVEQKDPEFYSAEMAAQKALEWCQNNPGWKRICDMEDSYSLYYTWGELPASVRQAWRAQYPDNPEHAWLEWGYKPCKVPFGFISGKGEFFNDILLVSRFHNFMMVFQVG